MKYRVMLIKNAYAEDESVDGVLEQMKKWELDGTFTSEDWDEIYIEEMDDEDITLGDGDVSISVDVAPKKSELS